MRLVTRCSWDPGFFRDFTAVRNESYQGVAGFVPEQLETFRKTFGPSAAFAGENAWQAWVAIDPTTDRPVARLLVSSPRTQRAEYLNAGYFECPRDLTLARLLWREAASVAQARQLAEIRGPIQGSFYYSYRMKVGGGAPLWGEPLYHDYYPELFSGSGFEIVKRWFTYRVQQEEAYARATSAHRLALEEGNDYRQIRVRSFDVAHWHGELRLLYTMMITSYRGMSEYVDIGYREFHALFADLRHFIEPRTALFAEVDGEPIGFTVGLFDPLALLCEATRRMARGSVLPRSLRRMLVSYWARGQLKRNRGRFLVLHVGKVPHSSGRNIRHVQQALESALLTNLRDLNPAAELYYCFVAEDSPALRLLDKKQLTPHAEYVLYGRRTVGAG